ncbi:MAG: HAD-IA family hydrolase [Sphingomonadaceae bacterium]|nr:HAD-IA family hydrolase [Sphingomonadaceae bacterium]
MTRLAVFDCDGTLVDSAATICRAMEMAFDDLRITWPGAEATRRIVGLSLFEAAKTILPGSDDSACLELAERYKAAFTVLRANGHVEEPLYPGAVEALAELEARGWQLGVATGKSDRGLRHCLAAHGLYARFVTLQTADRHPSKPHPSMLHAAAAEAGASHVAMIGDTRFDMLMGVAAGADPVGVGWGYHQPHELIATGARAVAVRYAEIPDLLETR